MQILAKKTYTFWNGAEQKTVGPSMSPQTVPDWVRDSTTFKLASQDGSVVEIQIVAPVVAPIVAPAAPPATPGPGAPEAAGQAPPASTRRAR
jgi:hypothetical protein